MTPKRIVVPLPGITLGSDGHPLKTTHLNHANSHTTMTETIVSIERIKAEAQRAAQQFTDVNDACPYPFYSDAGRAFKAEFTKQRLAQFAAANAKPQPTV